MRRRLSTVEIFARLGVTTQDAGRIRIICPVNPGERADFTGDGYHCFACGNGGDIFTYIMASQGVEFREALRIALSISTKGPTRCTLRLIVSPSKTEEEST